MRCHGPDDMWQTKEGMNHQQGHVGLSVVEQSDGSSRKAADPRALHGLSGFVREIRAVR